MSSKGHVVTYPFERTFSISANCNALMCLLNAPETLQLASTIEKVTTALCNCWCEDKMSDKWVGIKPRVEHN